MSLPSDTTLPPNEPPSSQTADGFQRQDVLTIAGGHFIHDTYSSFVSPLLPLIQERFLTNYALTGSLAVFTQLPSLLNPLIGYIADRVSVRYFIIFAPAATATLMSLIGLAPTYLSLVFLLLAAGVSIAAFHAPAPAMVAQVSGKRTGMGMGYFMASGELGRTVGPIVAVAGVNWFMLEGTWRLMFVGWASSVILYYRLKDVAARPSSKYGRSELTAIWPRLRYIWGLFTFILLARTFMVVPITTYLPLFMQDVFGLNFTLAGWSLALLEGAGVIGALTAGHLSDRVGRARILYILFSVAPFFYLAFIYAPQWLIIPLLIILGLTAISPTAVMLATVQDKFSENRALANGFFLASNFLTRAFTIWFIGFLADRLGLQTTYTIGVFVALLCIPGVYFIFREEA
ncbi:MAG: MFS transporter [Chloroflexota bacterium]